MKVIYSILFVLCLSQNVNAKMVTIRGEIQNYDSSKMETIRLFVIDAETEKLGTRIYVDSLGKFEFSVKTWSYHYLKIYSKHYKTYTRLIRYIRSGSKEINIHLIKRDKPLERFLPEEMNYLTYYEPNQTVDNAGFSIKGFVVDRKNEPVMFANVALYQNDTLITGVQTNINGFYRFNNLPNGIYRIEVAYVGCAMETVCNVEIINLKGLIINVKMKNEIMTYDMSIPYLIPLIEQDKTTQGVIFSAKEIQKSPNKN